MIDVADLRYFLAVASARSFNRGATAAHVTPAAISKAVRRLEEQLETTLFVRTTRSVALTPDGEALLEGGRAVLRAVDGLKEDLDRRRGTLGGPLRIAAMEVFSIQVVPLAVARLLAQAPAVSPSLHEMTPETMVARVASGDVDVGFTIGARATSGASVERIATSPGVLACGRRHPLHRRPRLRRQDLVRFPFVVPRFWGEESSPPIDQFPELLLPRRVGATIELLMSAVGLVEHGALLGFFPEVSIRPQLASGALRRVTGVAGLPTFDLQVVTPRAAVLKPAAARLVELVKQVLTLRATRRRAAALPDEAP